ncbi:hypothetical protein [Methanosarcina sp. 1.H.A.2.2]|uniref:hypothetical protein n=1 Tax=Methanosarcina sp. 1.H.A.2.2 TaxID=1483601 RepID=UPI0006213392|nr:hypothetical protein [Methanosarcina sp. 1.H.A.2.2]KKH45966.1 hypothetical protein EO93_06900 [Methanosarcina sp. 1.H.A.2.2]
MKQSLNTLITLTGSVPYIHDILILFKDKRYSKELNQGLAAVFYPKMDALEDAYFNFTMDMYCLLGVVFSGNCLIYNNSKKVTDTIQYRLCDSMNQLDEAFTKVISVFQIHKDEFKELFENEPKKKILLNHLISIYDPSKKEIDYLAFGDINFSIFDCTSSMDEPRVDFTSTLNEIQENTKIAKAMNITSLQQYQPGINMLNLFITNEKFRLEYTKFIKKWIPKNQTLTKGHTLKHGATTK